MASYPYNDVGCKTLHVLNGTTLAGNLNVTGTTTLSTKLALSNIATGTIAQTLVMDPAGSGVPIWRSNNTAYGNTQLAMSAQNYNSAATTALTFTAATNTNATFGPNAYSPPQPVGTTPFTFMTIARTGLYRITYSISLSNAAVGASQVSITLLQNGSAVGQKVYSSVLPAATTGTNVISGSFTVSLSLGLQIAFQANREQGTGVLTSLVGASVINIDWIPTTY